MTEIKRYICDHCGRRDFSSRNRLFIHIKTCDENPNVISHKKVNSDDNENPNINILVTGGRLRGKTLRVVEKYSFSDKCWKAMPPLLEGKF